MFLMVGLAEFSNEMLQPVHPDAASHTNGISLTIESVSFSLIKVAAASESH